LPESAPENVVAVIVLFDGLTLIVETLDIAAPVTLVVAGVNKIGWLALVLDATTFKALEVDAIPVKFGAETPVAANIFLQPKAREPRSYELSAIGKTSVSTLPINDIESAIAFPKSIVEPFTARLPAIVTSPVVTIALVLTTSK